MDITAAPPALHRLSTTSTSLGKLFNNFPPYIPSYNVELADLISKCFGISAACQHLSKTILQFHPSRNHSPSHAHHRHPARDAYHYEEPYLPYSREIDEVIQSLHYTFEDVKRIVGDEIRESRDRRRGDGEGYKRAWRELVGHFEEESGNRLGRRCEYYVAFIKGLAEGIVNGAPRDIPTFDDLAERIRNLYQAQRIRFRGIAGGAGGSAGIQPDGISPPLSPTSELSRPPSFERRRPSSRSNQSSRAQSRQRKHSSRTRRHSHSHSSSPGRDRRYSRSPSPRRQRYTNRNYSRSPSHSPSRHRRAHSRSPSPKYHHRRNDHNHYRSYSPPYHSPPPDLHSPPPTHHRPRRSTMEHGWNSHRMPFAPEPPLSPTPSSNVFSSSDSSSGSGSSGSWSSGSGHYGRHERYGAYYGHRSPERHRSPARFRSGQHRSEHSRKHWVKKVFDTTPPSTPLSATGRSGCWSAHKPGTMERLEEDGFEKIQELTFENGTLLVSFWQEPTQLVSRLLCETKPPGKSRKLASKSLTDLVVERSGSFLKFSLEKNGDYWAGLRFVCMEQLVIFFSIFLALRSHDSYDPLSRIGDHKLKGEVEVFEGPILDDRYQHFLKVLVDKESGCVRLQASILEGAMVRVPIWTAFITHSMHSPVWLDRVEPKVIHLAELHRYIFTEESQYAPQIAPGGSQELMFLSESVADAFQTAIYELTEPDEPEKKSKDKSSKDKDKSKDKSKDKKGGKGKDKGKEKGKSGGGGKTGKVGGGGGKDAGESWGHPNYPDGGPPKIYGGKVEGGGGGGKKKH